jgi:hypothetical protein
MIAVPTSNGDFTSRYSRATPQFTPSTKRDGRQNDGVATEYPNSSPTPKPRKNKVKSKEFWQERHHRDDPDQLHDSSSNKSSASTVMLSPSRLNLLDLRLVLLGVCFYAYRAAVMARLLDMRRAEPRGEGERRADDWCLVYRALAPSLDSTLLDTTKPRSCARWSSCSSSPSWLPRDWEKMSRWIWSLIKLRWLLEVGMRLMASRNIKSERMGWRSGSSIRNRFSRSTSLLSRKLALLTLLDLARRLGAAIVLIAGTR